MPAHRKIDMADFRKIQNTPKWTTSGTLNYDTPLARADGSTSTRPCPIAARAQQFEIAEPGLDQKGFALLDASIVWRSAGDRLTIGLHGKNLTNKQVYQTSGYNFLLQNPYTRRIYPARTARPAASPASSRSAAKAC